MPNQSVRRSRFRHAASLAAILALTASGESAWSAMVPASNYHLVMRIASFSATLSSIDINHNGQIVSTGPITVSLDTSFGPMDSYLDANLSDRSISIVYHLTADCDLLHSLGAPPQKYHCVTSAGPNSYTVDPAMVDEDNWTTLQLVDVLPLTTIGEFDADQLFGGWQYHNHSPPPPPAPVRPLPPPPPPTPRPIDPFLGIDNTAMLTVPLEIHNVTLVAPTGEEYSPTFHGGTISYAAVPVPEPIIAMSFLMLGSVSILRRPN